MYSNNKLYGKAEVAYKIELFMKIQFLVLSSSTLLPLSLLKEIE
jgi:hypothetical protein